LKKLINTEDLLEAARLNGFAGESAAKVLMLLSRFRRINKLYTDNFHKKGIEFIDSMIGQLGINFELIENELNNIPASGPFITVSNHPFGGIDGMLLIKLISAKRPEYKVVPDFVLRRIEPVADNLFPENPFESQKTGRLSGSAYNVIIQHLKNGNPIGLFPAGEVSGYKQITYKITDRQWQVPVLSMIKKSQVPVIPVYFQGKNSRLFHLLGRIHPRLQKVRLPSELFTKKKKIIRIRIGGPISVKDQEEFRDIARYGRFLRTKTYALGTALEVKKFFKLGGRRLKKAEPIIDPVPSEKIEAEIDRVLPEYSLFKSQNYNVICVPSVEIPNIMYEIGRLREVTFRLIGEGTNQQMDVDEFDLYYNQLILSSKSFQDQPAYVSGYVPGAGTWPVIYRT